MSSLIPALLSSVALLACGEVVPLEPGQDGGGGPDAGADHGSDSGSGSSTPDAAVEMPSPFELAVMTPKRPVLVGTTAQISVSIMRSAPFTGPVVVPATNLPDGVTATPLTLAAGETTGALTISVDPSAPHTLPTEITITATAESVHKLALATLTVHGPTGTLDGGFGTKLFSIGDGDDYADAMALQVDGKIVLAGTSVDAGGSNANFALVRLDRSGARDLAFGSSGNVVTDIGGGFDTAHGVALQADGKIVVVGSAVISGSGTDFAVARYLADGTLDTTFSGDGKVTTALGTDSDVAYAVAIQPDGKIVVAGSSQRGFATTGVDFAVVRYNADGSLDGSFNTTGIVTTPIAPSNNADVAYALALQPVDGETRIVVGGGESNFQLARYRSDGALDTTFGSNGKVATVFTGYTGGAARALALTADNSMFVAGYVAESWEHAFAVAKLTASGQPDGQFGPSVVDLDSIYSEASAIVLDGTTPIVAGYVHDSAASATDFALVRFQASGAVDPTFNGGRIITPVAPDNKSDNATAIALQLDERIPGVHLLAAGRAQDVNLDFAVTRYWMRVMQP